jgi:hypothetical protein
MRVLCIREHAVDQDDDEQWRFARPGMVGKCTTLDNGNIAVEWSDNGGLGIYLPRDLQVNAEPLTIPPELLQQSTSLQALYEAWRLDIDRSARTGLSNMDAIYEQFEQLMFEIKDSLTGR